MEVGGMGDGDGDGMEQAGWLMGGPAGRRRRDWLGGQTQETEELRCGVSHAVGGSQAKVWSCKDEWRG